MSIYILFDSSGILSPENASVQDTFSAKNDKEAIRKTNANWGSGSWALYEGDYLIAWKVWRWKGGRQCPDYWDKFQESEQPKDTPALAAAKRCARTGSYRDLNIFEGEKKCQLTSVISVARPRTLWSLTGKCTAMAIVWMRPREAQRLTNGKKFWKKGNRHDN
jgi:hypothetical protein